MSSKRNVLVFYFVVFFPSIKNSEIVLVFYLVDFSCFVQSRQYLVNRSHRVCLSRKVEPFLPQLSPHIRSGHTGLRSAQYGTNRIRNAETYDARGVSNNSSQRSEMVGDFFEMGDFDVQIIELRFQFSSFLNQHSTFMHQLLKGFAVVFKTHRRRIGYV